MMIKSKITERLLNLYRSGSLSVLVIIVNLLLVKRGAIEV
jgi:hypothetical protein